MGDTCSACKTKTQSKTEIINETIEQSIFNQNRPVTLRNTQKDFMSEMFNNTYQNKFVKSKQSNNQGFLQLKYTNSFGQHEHFPTFDMKSQAKIMKLQDKSSSINTVTLKEMKGNYLKDLFSAAENQVIKQIEKKKSTQENNYLSPNNQVSSHGCNLKRTVSNKSQSNKIDRQFFIRISKQNINQKYTYNHKIGEGGFGFVYKGYNKMNKQQRAIKIIKKRRLTQRGGQQALFARTEILREVDHPNIIKLYDVIQYKNTFYIVTQYCDGGQLFEAVRRAKYFTQGHVAHVMTQILSVVNYLEKKGIVHRDLKPQNIVLESKYTGSNIKQIPLKILDFGTASYCRPGQILRTQVGSPYYIAPEVIKQQYNTKCDMWSCGVIMYVLLCGCPPFRGRVQKDIFEAILKGKFTMQGAIWNKISDGAKQLIRLMLQINPEKRISAQQAIKHPWMTQFHESSNLIEAEVLNNMQNFFFKNKFLAVIQTFLAMKTISQQDRRSLTDKFKQLDKDNSGVLQINEVIQAYKSIYDDANQQDIKRILQNIDTDHSGNIELTQFIVATIQQQKLYKKQALQNAWQFFDKDKTGYLDLQQIGLIIGDSTTDELKTIMNQLGAEGEQMSKQKFMKLFESKLQKK